ncbi:MAG: PAS domain S-box protein [Chloroflexota bacterium]
MTGPQPAAPPPHRRPSPPAAAALFVAGGIVLLLVPQLIARLVSGATPDVANVLGATVFLVVGAAAVFYLAGRIESAFRTETTAREAVERRERVLAEVIDAVPAAVLLLADDDEPTVAHANPAASRLLSLGDAGDAPRRLGSVVPVDDETVEALRASLQARSAWSAERTVTTGGDRRLPLHLAVTPISAGSGVRAVMVATDRTELHFAERESERLAVELEGFVQTAPVGFVTVGADGLVAAWNAAAERILGWTAAEMVGQRLPVELGGVIAASLAAGAGLPGSPRPATASPPDAPEVRLRRSTGDEVSVRLTATTAYGRGNDFFGFTAMFEDVTEARRIAHERDEAESRFRAAIDASPVPLVLLDPEGKVRLWSAAAERLFGWTADEAMGRLFPPVPDDGLAHFFDRLRQVLEGERVDERCDYERRDGQSLPTLVSSAPVRTPDGALVGVMTACREAPGPTPADR